MAKTSQKISLVLLAVSVLLFAAIVASLDTVARIFLHERATYQSLHTQIEDAEHKLDQLTVAEKSAQNVRGDVSSIQQAFVDEGDILRVLVPLEQEANKAGITKYKVTVAGESSAASSIAKTTILPGTTLRIEGEGTVQEISAFAQVLQGLPYFLRIDSFQVQQAATTSAPTALLQAAIIVKFYSLPQ